LVIVAPVPLYARTLNVELLTRSTPAPSKLFEAEETDDGCIGVTGSSGSLEGFDPLGHAADARALTTFGNPC
jgi:hypothetical protein